MHLNIKYLTIINQYTFLSSLTPIGWVTPCCHVAEMVLTVVVFDFDRTIIDDDSDRWVINQMGLTDLFNQLRTTLPWTSLMDTIMQHLHSNGITIDNIAQSLKTAFLHPNIVSAIKSAHSLGYFSSTVFLLRHSLTFWAVKKFDFLFILQMWFEDN